MELNIIEEQYSEKFFYEYGYDCADVYIWSGQICISKDYLKKIINACNNKEIKNILNQTLDDRETYKNVRPLINPDKMLLKEKNKIKHFNKA